jgi:hypothetical protein
MNIFFFLLMNSFITPLTWLLNIERLVKYFQRGKALSDGILSKETTIITQRELNEMFEEHDINFGSKFAHICNLLLLSLFFLPILPIGVLISFCGLVLTYLVEKYNILHVYRRPKMGDATLVKFLLYQFKIFIFIYAVRDCIYLDR